jgi:hypothetical protein
MKIYVVTKGCYSDYHIITATTDEKLAYKIKDKFNGGSYDETNVEVFEDAEILMKPCYFLRFDKSGNVIESYEESENEYGYEQSQGEDVRGNFYIHIPTDSMESAIKIGAEKRAMFLVQKEGI